MFLFFNDTATTEIYTLSLHDALPISGNRCRRIVAPKGAGSSPVGHPPRNALDKPNISKRGKSRKERPDFLTRLDRKSTRLNSSHANISYAVFCLKKKRILHTPAVLLS